MQTSSINPLPCRKSGLRGMITMKCANCMISPAEVEYCRYEPYLHCPRCCYAPLCVKCSELQGNHIYCQFCKEHIYVDIGCKKPSTKVWIDVYGMLEESSTAINQHMPYFFLFLQTCSSPIYLRYVNTAATYEMYMNFMCQIQPKMHLHLWGKFSRMCLSPSVRVIGGNMDTFNSVTKHFVVVNQIPDSWLPTRSQVCRSRFGLISRIAMKMATGYFNIILPDGSIQVVFVPQMNIYGKIMRRILSLPE